MESPPNVVVVVIDTVRAATGASFFNEDAALSRIASKGTVYRNTTTPAPWTLPSHASLFTGTYPSKHGAHAGHKRLEPNLMTIAEVFKDAGYQTVGVSNNTWISREFGFERGFEEFFRTWQLIQSNKDLGSVARTTEGSALIAAMKRLFEGNPTTNAINALYGKFLRKRHDKGARRTNRWLSSWLKSRDDSRPFFLFVNYLEPHLEYRPLRDYAEQFLPDDVQYEEAMAVNQNAWGYIAGEVEMDARDFEILRSLYRAEIDYVDEQLGALLSKLRAEGYGENTVFVVTSDHGENIGEHGLMDHQYCLYETLLHVPLVISGGPFETGQTSDELIQLNDIPLTLLDVADIRASEFRKQVQGRSFHPHSTNETRDYAFAEYLAPQPSLDALKHRVGDLSEEVQRFDRSLRSVRGRDWKFIRGSDGSKELYHLASDPNEVSECSSERPSRVEELEAELNKWLESFDHADVSGEVEMSAETKDRLEDLGYLQ